jgi:radical SAM protein with 4Fe4S-binding SPASM domain
MPLNVLTDKYPRMVSVETTNRCNATCTFCPNNVLSRDRQTMSDELFEKIIEDCREFPLPAIEPFLQGEPFLDPQILPRLEYIRRRLPATRLRLYTNGYAMTPKKIDAFLDLGIDHLFVSVNTLDSDKYQRVMGLRLERTLENLAYLTEPHRRARIARRISFRMTRLPDTTLEEQRRFRQYCRERGVRSFIVALFNYKGDIGSSYPVPRYGCGHVTRVDILADGRVTLCCMDHDGKYSWGDVNEHSVLEVYRSAVAQRYQLMHKSGRRGEIEPCSTCNYFWPGFRGLSPAQAVRTGVEVGLYLLQHRPNGKRAPTAA